MRVYTPKEISFIKRHFAGRSRAAMTELFNQQYFTSPITLAQMTAFLKNHKLRNGLDGRFRPGQAVHNKGTKGLHSGSSTSFKKGRLPWNYLPVGSERVNGDGYVDVKIADPKTWKAKHLLIWEAANGKVPEGHIIIFADGNKMNLTLDNLIMVTRAELVVMNKLGLVSSLGELTIIGKTVANIKMAIADRTRSLKKRTGRTTRRSSYDA